MNLKQQTQLYTGLLRNGICEYIYIFTLGRGYPCINEPSVLLFSGCNGFETGLLLIYIYFTTFITVYMGCLIIMVRPMEIRIHCQLNNNVDIFCDNNRPWLRMTSTA